MENIFFFLGFDYRWLDADEMEVVYGKFHQAGFTKVTPEMLDVFGPLVLYYACPPMLAVLMQNVISALSRGYCTVVAGPTWNITLVIFAVFCMGTGGNKTAICSWFLRVSFLFVLCFYHGEFCVFYFFVFCFHRGEFVCFQMLEKALNRIKIQVRKLGKEMVEPIWSADGSWAKLAKRLEESFGVKLCVFDEPGALNNMNQATARKSEGVPTAASTAWLRLWDGFKCERDLQVFICLF